MVGPVEGLDTECDFLCLSYVEILKEPQIVVLEARAVQEIAHPLDVERAISWGREDRRAVRVLGQEPVILIRSAAGKLPLSLDSLGLPLTIQNCAPLPGPTPAKSSPVATERGVPVWNCEIAEKVQPPRSLPINLE